MINYGDQKLNSLLASPNWDDHTENSDLEELLDGWRIVGVQLLKNKERYTTDCILILEEPTGQIRALNITNPNYSRRGRKWGSNGPLRIELERLPGEPVLKRPRQLVLDLGKLARSGKMGADEREEWFVSGSISRTEYDAIETAADFGKYEASFRELAKAGLWSELFQIAEGSEAALVLALKIGTEHAQEIEPEEWRDFVIWAIDSVDPRSKRLREALATLPKDGAKDLPEEYGDEVLEVYQVTHTITDLEAFNLGELPKWTYDEAEAMELFEYYYKGGKFGARIYRGKLKRSDVIGVVPEVGDLVQLDNVYNIELIEADDKGSVIT